MKKIKFRFLFKKMNLNQTLLEEYIYWHRISKWGEILKEVMGRKSKGDPSSDVEEVIEVEVTTNKEIL
jgi:hypothetical protein